MLREHELSAKLRSIFSETLNAETSPDTDLVAAGLLDSLTLVSLLMRLEEGFGIKLDMEVLDLDAFRTPSSIAALLSTMVGSSGGPAEAEEPRSGGGGAVLAAGESPGGAR